MPESPSPDLVYSQERPNGLLIALGDGTPICDGVDLGVHEQDEMWRLFYYRGSQDLDQSLVMYFLSGWHIWSTYRKILGRLFGDPGRVGKILDFASGYGRVTRFIVRDIPAERVWISDIYADGVRFQQERFGVHGIVSAVDPSELSCGERFDTILVSSLFSHLPDETFLAWLRRLWSLLAPGGVLVFSVHDEALLPPGREMPARGISFEEQSESGSLSKAQYGTAWVTEGYVREAVAQTAPGASVARLPRGFANLQDLYVVVDRPGVDLAGLPVSGGVEGALDHCGFAPPRQIVVSGWAVDRATGKPLEEVRARIDGNGVAATRDFHPRPEAAGLFPLESVQPVGWKLELDLPPGTDRATALLTLAGLDANGRETILFENPVQATLLRSARMGLLYTHRDMERMRVEHAEELARVRAEAEARIAGMEASRFWKARNKWFALKRQLHLTDEP
jgi:SAM-dependent methyltransferase